MTPLEELQNALASYLVVLRSEHTPEQELAAWLAVDRAQTRYGLELDTSR